MAIEDMYFDQRPDPEHPDMFDVIKFRMPHGGRPRPEFCYTGKEARNRAYRFAVNFLIGWYQSRRDQKTVTRLERMRRRFLREEEAGA